MSTAPLKNHSTLKSVFALSGQMHNIVGIKFYGILILQFLSGFLENLGIFALLPIIYVALNIEDEQPNEIKSIIMDFFTSWGLSPTLENLLLLLVAIISLKALMSFLVLYISKCEVIKIGIKLRAELIQNVFSAKWEFFSTLTPGKYGSIMTGEIQKAKDSFNTIFLFFNAGALCVIYGISAFIVSWELTLTAALFSALSIFIFTPFIKKTRANAKKTSELLNLVTSYMINAIQGIKYIKAMGIEEKSKSILLKDNQSLFRTLKHTSFLMFATKSMREPFVVIGLGGTILLSIYGLNIPVANLGILLLIFNRSLTKVLEIQSLLQAFANNEPGYINVMNAINEAKKQKEDDTQTQNFTLDKHIETKSLSTFAGETTILKAVNITLPNYSLNVFLGPSGQGKTTLIDTLIGLRESYTGDIFYDDLPLRKVSKQSLKSHTGYVGQDLQLFHASIKDNILIGQPKATDQEIKDILKLVNADEFIRDLPDGINTIVGEAGERFSGGQRQRLLLARALIRQPKILILDEVTSALDKENGRIIMDMIVKVSKNTCVLLITHDQSGIDVADQVFEIKNKIVKQIK